MVDLQQGYSLSILLIKSGFAWGPKKLFASTPSPVRLEPARVRVEQSTKYFSIGSQTHTISPTVLMHISVGGQYSGVYMISESGVWL